MPNGNTVIPAEQAALQSTRRVLRAHRIMDDTGAHWAIFGKLRQQEKRKVGGERRGPGNISGALRKLKSEGEVVVDGRGRLRLADASPVTSHEADKPPTARRLPVAATGFGH